jgi:hypothetical protein
MPAGVFRHQNDTYTRPINWWVCVVEGLADLFFCLHRLSQHLKPIGWEFHFLVAKSFQAGASSLWELRLGNQLKCFFYLFSYLTRVSCYHGENFSERQFAKKRLFTFYFM